MSIKTKYYYNNNIYDIDELHNEGIYHSKTPPVESSVIGVDEYEGKLGKSFLGSYNDGMILNLTDLPNQFIYYSSQEELNAKWKALIEGYTFNTTDYSTLNCYFNDDASKIIRDGVTIDYSDIYGNHSLIIRDIADLSVEVLSDNESLTDDNLQDGLVVCDRKAEIKPNVTITRVIGFNNTKGSFTDGSVNANSYATMYDASGVAIPYDSELITCCLTNDYLQTEQDTNGWSSNNWPVSSTTSGYLRVKNEATYTMSCGACLFYKSSESTTRRFVYSAQGNQTSAAEYTINGVTWYYVLCLDETTWVKGEEGLNTIGFYLTKPTA